LQFLTNIWLCSYQQMENHRLASFEMLLLEFEVIGSYVSCFITAHKYSVVMCLVTSVCLSVLFML